MVQSRHSPAVEIQLTPMQIPEAVPGAGLSFAGPEGMNATAYNLLLHPGQPSEMIVHLKNLEDRPLRLSLKVEGEFPSQWCQIGTEGREIPPGGQMDAVLYFTVPATFFEDQEAISPGKKDKLTLNFHCLVVVNIDQGTEREQIQHSEIFNLYIRPYSFYMEFLPVLYREIDFIGRFIKIFEQAYQPAIDSFNVMWANIDPLTAPRALLPFLAHWVAWQVDSVWSLDQQRRLIRRAVEIYRWRGTRKGLRLYLHLYTGLPLDEDIPNERDKHISITEPFGPSFILGDAHIGSAVLAGGQAYHFVVHLRKTRSNQLINEQLIRTIIEQEKPAFCTYELFIENQNP
ncbi:phage tail protein [Tolypothrix sp. FACHB-123]|uniref:phage tail protein n=1 Tax=Tolypothrix sp. FACHB-123 TaxID=2692868 RepID=UPI001689ABE5|nr:phage tail protein [Tolypothrix sp. FACHB-123]MBD2359078.1 phage tail protein [Tolypothrix sp. FACHB-123]